MGSRQRESAHCLHAPHEHSLPSKHAAALQVPRLSQRRHLASRAGLRVLPRSILLRGLLALQRALLAARLRLSEASRQLGSVPRGLAAALALPLACALSAVPLPAELPVLSAVDAADGAVRDLGAFPARLHRDLSRARLLLAAQRNARKSS